MTIVTMIPDGGNKKGTLMNYPTMGGDGDPSRAGKSKDVRLGGASCEEVKNVLCGGERGSSKVESTHTDSCGRKGDGP